MDPAHRLGVALGQVVVDRHDVDALAGDRVQVGREGGDQRLALTGLHLGDIAEVHGGAAHQLDVEVALAERATAGLADGGERFGKQVVEGLAIGITLLEFLGHPAQLGVGKRLEIGLDLVNRVGERFELAQDPSFARAKHLLQDHVDSPPLLTGSF